MNLAEILDLPTLRRFRRLFHSFTGLITSLYFPDWRGGSVDVVPRKSKTAFCEVVQRSRGGLRACLLSDSRLMERLVKEGKPLVYECHAGITGMAAPVHFEGKCHGAVLAGDLLVRPPNRAGFESVKRKLAGLDIDFEALEKAYYHLPVASPTRIRLAVEMLSLIVNYIVDREQIISLQERIYEKQREISDSVVARAATEKAVQEKLGDLDRLREKLLVAQRGEKIAVVSDTPGSRRTRVVREMLSFVDQYYAARIKLSDVAEHVRLSPNYVSALFRQECGFTLKDYLVTKRIQKACELLQEQELNVSQTRAQVGYNNISHFNRMFKKIVGITPGQYRDRITIREAAPPNGE